MAIKKRGKTAGYKGGKTSSKKTPKPAGRRVPSELILNDLKLKFTKVVDGVSIATLRVQSGAACAGFWTHPSRCLVHGQVHFDERTTVLQAKFEGVPILDRKRR
jgi:hypothetical protein